MATNPVTTAVLISGSDAQVNSVLSFMKMRKIPFVVAGGDTCLCGKEYGMNRVFAFPECLECMNERRVGEQGERGMEVPSDGPQ